MRIHDKKTVFFDLDHTLWDFEKNSALAFETVLEKHRVGVDPKEFLKEYIPINVAYWKQYRDGHVNQQQLRYGRLKDAFDAISYQVSDEVIDVLSDDYIAHLPLYNHLYDGTIELLDYLKPKYSLHIITNGFHTVQEGKLKNSNIMHYFETVTNSELAGCKKPHPDIYEYALRVSGAEKQSSIMIGDCIEADVQGALDCGIDAIYFNEFKKVTQPHIVQVHRLSDIKNIL